MAKKEPEWVRQLRALDSAAEIFFGKGFSYYGARLVERLAFFASAPRPKAPTTPDPNDPYTVLDIPPNSPNWLVDLAYRNRAKKAHPDMPGGSEEEMKRINNAYQKIKEVRK